MKATEIRDSIFAIEKQLHALSEAIAKPIEFDGIDKTYLQAKYKSLCNTVDHIKLQLKHK